jgi:hypothetical protein
LDDEELHDSNFMGSKIIHLALVRKFISLAETRGEIKENGNNRL